MDVEGETPQLPEGVQAQVNHLSEQIADCQQKIFEEGEKLQRWKVENVRRKHNYIPFIVNFLKYLAEQDQLLPLIENTNR